MAFHHYELDNGFRLYVQPTAKFKTVMIKVFWQQNLDQHAAQNALLAMVLRRGTRTNPTTRGINRLLEDLYGAELDSRVVKKGERHILEFQLELVQDSLVEEAVLIRGLELLRDVILDPLLVDSGFAPDYVEQEKEQLRQIIAGIVNDKVQYAVERCLEETGRGEPFGISRYGDVAAVNDVSPGQLYDHYLAQRDSAPMDIFVVGDVEPQKVLQSVTEVFSLPCRGGYVLQTPVVKVIPGQVKEIVEQQDVNQGKLCLSYRTQIAYADANYPALVVYNGILGGFAHAKLFQNVREKASLAYYASSRLEKTKGILLIAAGIESKNYASARRIIADQVQAMADGNISDLEMDNTKKALLNQLRASRDNYNLTIDMALDGLVNGLPREEEELARQIEAVQRQDLINVASGLKLDTVYFLTNPEGAGANA